jgi:hypothetical protein
MHDEETDYFVLLREQACTSPELDANISFQLLLQLCRAAILSLIKLALSQKAPKMTPSRAQNMLMVIALVILKPMTRSIGAFIGSGFAGIARYTPAIIAAYVEGIIIIAFFVLFEDATTIFRYKNASPSALNPDIAKNTT